MLAVIAAVIFTTFAIPTPAFAMHIMEGYMPPLWCIAWYIIAAPFVIYGSMCIVKISKSNPKLRMLVALVAAYAFVLSALKIPSVTGSCSHPTGMGLGSVIFGPWVMAVVGIVVLLFQAILLAHGGITTLGANTVSMGVVGPIISAFTYWLVAKKLKSSKDVAIFLAASLGSLMTYVAASIELAIAYPSATGGVLNSFSEFASIFAITQLPLSTIEGLLTMLIFRYIRTYNEA
ncbi:MAG: energy-coupling factor ABC transporter permease, partial [Actinobacteria bacterium]|nr:energy-coupling factor ABC transporter permease [Actinomycetota bacterium]